MYILTTLDQACPNGKRYIPLHHRGHGENSTGFISDRFDRVDEYELERLRASRSHVFREILEGLTDGTAVAASRNRW
jgi:hypothetical protein